MKGFLKGKPIILFSFNFVLSQEACRFEADKKGMHWPCSWSNLSRDIGMTSHKTNWTSPFLKNVFDTLNQSLVGSQRVETYNGTSFSIYECFPHAEQYGLATAIILIILINLFRFKRDNGDEKHRFTLPWPQFINPKICLQIASFTIFICVLPIVCTILSLFYLNRTIVSLILKIKHGKKFVRLLNGTDTIWALEEDNAKSIINVITLVEVEEKTYQLNKDALFENIKEVLLKKMFGSDCPYPKMMYKRSFEKGYFFWEINKKLQIDDYVRPMIFSDKPNNTELTDGDLENYVSKRSNMNLPENNASWEILIGNRPIMRLDGSSSTKKKLLPILFRIHHSLGDGVVLLKLLLRTIADEKYIRRLGRRQFKLQKIPSIIMQSMFDYFTYHNFKIEVAKIINYVKRGMHLLTMVPASIVGQVLRPCDNNAIHGPILSGKKVVSWISESDYGESLLHKMKEMKKKVPGATFSDIFLTALSASFNKYFTKCCLLDKITVPEYITAVVPVRADNTDLRLHSENIHVPLKLENKFSVALLTIPVTLTDSSDGESFSHMKRLADVRRETNKLRKSADFQVNFCLMSVVGHVLPESLLRPLLYSEQASVVISNLPGPSGVTINGGHIIHDMVFFVPHRGTTGVGVTLLTINERIHLGLMADSSLIGCSEDAHGILKGIVDELTKIDTLTLRRLQSQEGSLEMHS